MTVLQSFVAKIAEETIVRTLEKIRKLLIIYKNAYIVNIVVMCGFIMF